MKNVLRTKCISNIFMSAIFLVILLTYSFASSASIIDDIKNVFSSKIESSEVTKEVNKINEIIDSELRNKLTNNEKEVVEQIENAVKSIKSVDIDKIFEVFGAGISVTNKKNITSFLMNIKSQKSL